jgi:preprotein translocase subunit SecF
MELVKPGTKVPFTRYRKIAFILSSMANLAILFILFTQGPNLGVDFAGGTMVHLRFHERVTIPDIRQALDGTGFGAGVIQDFGDPGANEYLLRLDKTAAEIGALSEQLTAPLAEQFGAGQFEIRRIESVGPRVGEDLRFRGLMSVLASTVMMGIYIWIRFELRFGIGALIALVHDLLITVGALLVAGYEFDLTIVAALLAVIGYSVNDTVIVCDRIRENMRKMRRDNLENIINTSINETLSRTIITSGTAITVLLALFFLGGGVVRPFAFTLLVGFVTGVYSTIFIASPIVLLWEKRKLARASSIG